MIILDASALYPLAKLSASNPLEAAKRLLEEDAAILDLTVYEVANAALMEARRGLIEDPLRFIKAFRVMAELLTMIRVEPGDVEEIARLARELGLTAYDAAYVYYARRHGARLLTGDGDILQAAPDVALDVEKWLEEE